MSIVLERRRPKAQQSSAAVWKPRRLGLPVPPVDNQGDTYRCGAFSVRQWFEGYGFEVADTQAFARTIALADAQEGLAFSQVYDYVIRLAAEVGATLQWLGNGYLVDFATFNQALADRWAIVVGVNEAYLNPGQNYMHYIDPYLGSDGALDVADSFHLYDHEDGHLNAAQLQQAILNNWDPYIIGLAFQVTNAPNPAPAPAPMSVNAQLVTILSVIGDDSYKLPQTADTYHIQVLVQQAKALLGA